MAAPADREVRRERGEGGRRGKGEEEEGACARRSRGWRLAASMAARAASCGQRGEGGRRGKGRRGGGREREEVQWKGEEEEESASARDPGGSTPLLELAPARDAERKLLEKRKKRKKNSKKMVPDLDPDPDFKNLPVAHLHYY
jgi:hypothetical protein